ncbi:hypothetical protein Q7I15_05620 [Aeromonas veronii]|uniref:hypothetical protein n=1 Tax=Aeromonas veronii TaxID=654 RepID=UPI0030049320
MSDAIQIAKEAPKHVEGMLAEMFAANAEDNRVCLGGVYAGAQYIQIQLVVTSNPAQLMDDGDADDEPDGEVVASSHSQLYVHWLAARADFISPDPRTEADELLALGAIRAIYWLALGQGDTPLATEIGDWWKEGAPLHRLGEVIR